MVLPTDELRLEPSVIQVVVVDDHRMIAESITAYLSAAPDIHVRGLATSGAETLQLLRSTRVDVVLLDYHLPDLTGDELARAVLAEWPTIRIIMITAIHDDSVAAAAIASGCHGFLPKDRSGSSLVDAVRAVHSGVAVFDPTTVVRAMPFLRRRPHENASEWHLTPREREVLGCLADGSSTGEIAHSLDISPVTVRNHIQRILGKLDAHSRLEAVSMGIRAGLLPAYTLPDSGAAAADPLQTR